MARQPALFLAHGAPTLPFEVHGAVPFLRGLAENLEKPRAILVVSAHWEASVPTISTTAKPETIHDFHGFPEDLYKLVYPAPGAPETAERTNRLLRQSFPVVGLDQRRGLDHGAWIPLLLVFPAAEIPTFQVSLQWQDGPEGAFALGEALAPLRDEGVLIIGSGSPTHNLSLWRNGSDTDPRMQTFDDWLEARIREDDREALIDYRRRAPHAIDAHPRDEHLLPLMVAMGAGNEGKTLYRGFAHGALSMACYEFT